LQKGNTETGFTPENILYTPENIVSFIAKLVSQWNPKRVLDPACGSASFFPAINSVIEDKPRFIGVDIGKEIIENTNNNLRDSDIDYELFNTDFFDFKNTVGNKFDLIVSQPSFVQLQEVKELSGFKVLDIEIAFLLSCLDLLHEDGHLVLILPEQKSFFYSDYYYDMRKYLVENYSVEAIISLPIKTMYPFSSIKTCILVIKNSKQREQVFFSNYLSGQGDQIIENYIENLSNENLYQGFWTDSSELLNDNVYWIFDYLRGQKESQKKMEESPYSLRLLADLTKFRDRPNPNGIFMLLPKLAYKDVIFYSELENPDDLDSYYPFIVSDKNVSAAFLKIYLNSDTAKNDRNLLSYGSTNKRLSKKGLKSLYIEVPDLETQNKIVETCQKADKLYDEIESVYTNFKRDVFNYEVLDELLEKYAPPGYPYQIWPFSTSYRMLSKSGANPSSRLDMLFKMAEMISAFNAIVLLSALPEEIYELKKDIIWDKENLHHTRMLTFGGWLYLYTTLSEIYQEMDRDTCEVLPFGKNFFNKIANKTIINSLKPLKEKRNELAHGSPLSEILAEKTFNDLNKYLNDIFKLLHGYEKLWLIYPTGLEKSGGLYTIKAKVLKGSAYPFEEKSFQTETDMDTRTLYLFDKVTHQRLKLNTDLLNLRECQECGGWALYFYNKLEEDYAKYISYQYEPHDYRDEDKTVERLFHE